MHVRLVIVAREAPVSVRGASEETECRGVFGPILVIRRTMPMNPSGVLASWERAASESPRHDFPSWRAVGHTSDVIAKQLHLTNFATEKLSVPTRCCEPVARFTTKIPNILSIFENGVPSTDGQRPDSAVCTRAYHWMLQILPGDILVRDTLWP